ncbi:MAG: hypothetical protein LBL47_00495 [Lactobacillus sp.]|jgi:hypothetical protein|nr:hypothetical protein [Lactobacillus sp.]
MSIFDVTMSQKEKIVDGSMVKKYRTIASALVLLQIVLAMFLSSDVYAAAGALMVYPVALFLVAMGYRIGYIWLIIMRAFDVFAYQIEGERVPYMVLLFAVLFIAFYFAGLRVEVNRIRFEKSGEIKAKKPHKIRDTIFAVVIFVVTTFIGLVIASDDDFEEDEIIEYTEENISG